MKIEHDAATKQPLQKGPADMTQHRPSSGRAEILGSEAPISRNPVDMTKFFDSSSMVIEHDQASKAPLSTREHHGYEGAMPGSHTPMSARSLNKANK